MNLQVFLEWFHRLDAFVVGVAFLVLAGTSVLQRRRLPRWLPWAAAAALLLVAVQGGLGALTVLHLLQAGTVTAHLATALLLVLLLSAITQGLDPAPRERPELPAWWTPLAVLAGIPLFAQCLLGGSMASRWAVDRCLQAGEVCHWLAWHRHLAGPAAIALVALAGFSWILPRQEARLRLLTGLPVVVVAAQVWLGLTTLRQGLAVPALTIAHQLGAALLVACLGAIWGRSLALAAPSPSADPVSNPIS